jgi:hypothetical protein
VHTVCVPCTSLICKDAGPKRTENHFAEPNWHVLTFHHQILMCRVTYWAPLWVLFIYQSFHCKTASNMSGLCFTPLIPHLWLVHACTNSSNQPFQLFKCVQKNTASPFHACERMFAYRHIGGFFYIHLYETMANYCSFMVVWYSCLNSSARGG